MDAPTSQDVPTDVSPMVAKVTFNPPLWTQRRTWALDQLRKERATSVIDLGCGEGSLLSVLMEPSAFLSSHEASLSTDLTLNIQVQRIVGIDLEPSCVQEAKVATDPAEFASNSWLPPRPRWIDLEVQIWRGGLQLLGDDTKEGKYFGFGDWDVIVSTEVVEHLPESVLENFLPTALGVYQPKILLLTTPNYNFNQLFTPPGVRNLATGFPDPTGATDRIFRHDDHQREWTEEEWRDWCNEGASQWGYSVQVGSLGVAEQDDPWGRRAAAGKASLTAIFRRVDKVDHELEDRRQTALQDSRLRTSNGDEAIRHHLVARHKYQAHSGAGKPESSENILIILKKLLQNDEELMLDEGEVTVEQIWLRDEVPIACGGMVDVLFSAVESAVEGEWKLQREFDEVIRWREEFWTWRVIWKGFVKQELAPQATVTEPDTHWPSEGEESKWASFDWGAVDPPTVGSENDASTTVWGDASSWEKSSWGEGTPSWRSAQLCPTI